MEYLKIGVIVNTFGIKGELKIKSYTDFDEERFGKGKEIYIKENDEYFKFEIVKMRYHKDMLLIALKDKEDINLVEKYKGLEVYANSKDVHKLAEGEYYFFELAGLDVYDMDNKCIGKVLKVEEGLAHNNLRVELLDGSVRLVPFVDAFIHKVDLERKRMWIKVIDGLL